MFYCESGKPLYKKKCHFLSLSSLSSSSSKKKRKKGKKDTEATIERVKIRKERKGKEEEEGKTKIKRVIDFCEKEINKIMKIINNKCVYTYL